LLRRTLNRRIGRTGLTAGYMARLWLGAALGAAVGWAIKLGIGEQHPVVVATLVIVPYGLTYFAITAALKVTEANTVLGRALRLLRLRT